LILLTINLKIKIKMRPGGPRPPERPEESQIRKKYKGKLGI